MASILIAYSTAVNVWKRVKATIIWPLLIKNITFFIGLMLCSTHLWHRLSHFHWKPTWSYKLMWCPKNYLRRYWRECPNTFRTILLKCSFWHYWSLYTYWPTGEQTWHLWPGSRVVEYLRALFPALCYSCYALYITSVFLTQVRLECCIGF